MMLSLWLLCFLLTQVVGKQTSRTQVKWTGGITADICIDHDLDIDCGWEMEITFSIHVSTLYMPSAEVVRQEAFDAGTRFIVRNRNSSQIQGRSTCHTFSADCSGTPEVSASFTKVCKKVWRDVTRTSGDEGSTGTGSQIPRAKLDYDYYDALQKSMLFYFAQRSGPINDNIIPWRTRDSAMSDGSDVHRDLVGGWYDAGDHVKFNFPMAWSTTALLWGFIKWGNAYQAIGKTNRMYKLVRQPLDYFLKCWDNQNQILYGQVGDGNIDHNSWVRPEDMTSRRPSFKLDRNHGGSDLAGETAAALAAGAIAFRTKDSTYSSRLLTAAEQIYNFADKYRKKYHESITDAEEFYKSWDGYYDELCWGAAWLLKATGKETYRTKAEAAMVHMDQHPSELSWDSKAIGCYMLMYEQSIGSKKSAYRYKIENFMGDWVNFRNSVKETPCGLAFLLKWGSLRYAANAALLGLVAAENGINPLTYRSWAEKQIKYMLGANKKGFSYQVGFGTNFPLRPHHASATCPVYPAPCDWSNYSNPGPNVNELTGALVGGPGENDDYADVRSDYVKNEVTVSYNAGFQSALAGLVSLHLSSELPDAKPKCTKQ